MQEIKAKKLIKLGTAVRYLVDVKYKMSDKYTDDEPLGDDHVIDNINNVLDLVSELGLNGTVESGAFGKLQTLRDELKKESRDNSVIRLDQAERLSEISRIIRGSLISEGNEKLIYYLEPEELESATSPGWPKDVTAQLALNAPKNIRKLVLWLLGSAFAVGVAIGETGITANLITSLIPKSEEISQPQIKGDAEQETKDKITDGEAPNKPLE